MGSGTKMRVFLLFALIACSAVAVAETIYVQVRIIQTGGDEKTITRDNLVRIKQFILKNGQRETYCNMYNNNPAYQTKSFRFYLEPDSGPQNLNCDPAKSDFNSLTIRSVAGGKNQYRTVEFLDQHAIYITADWPTGDLTVNQIRQVADDALQEILAEVDTRKPTTSPADTAPQQPSSKPATSGAIFPATKPTIHGPATARCDQAGMMLASSLAATATQPAAMNDAGANRQLIAEVGNKLPKEWQFAGQEEGIVTPACWPQGKGIRLVWHHKERNHLVDWRDKPFGVAGFTHLWIMDADYSPKEEIYARDGRFRRASIAPAEEIAVWRGRRVFLWVGCVGGVDTIKADVLAALKATDAPAATQSAAKASKRQL